MTSLEIRSQPAPEFGNFHVWAYRGEQWKHLGSFLVRKEAEACFKEHLREIAIQDGSDYLFGQRPA